MTSPDRREIVRTNAFLPPRYPRPAIHVGATGHVVEDQGFQSRVYFPQYGMSYLVDRASLDTVPDGVYAGLRVVTGELIYGELSEQGIGNDVIVTDSGAFTVTTESIMPVTTESRYTTAELTSIVDLWERLCAITVGETTGEYLYSTRHLTPGSVYPHTCRMPDATEIRALVLSNGEETAYPKHGEFEDGRFMEHESPYSYGDQLYPITLTLISCGDYHGSDYDAANNRALDNNFVGVEVRYPNTGGQGSVESVSTVVLGCMSEFGDDENEEIDNLRAVVEAIEGLHMGDSSLLDDELHSEYVSSLAEDAWDQYLSRDVQSELVEVWLNTGDGAPMSDYDVQDYVDSLWDTNFNADNFHDAYYSFEGNEWTVESGGATNVINGRHDEAVRHAAHVVYGWHTCDCYVCTNIENLDES